MRRKEKSRPERWALDLFARAPYAHLAFALDDGTPVLRALHVVVHGGRLCFHGAKAGEKTLGLGRAAVLSVESPLATIPSTWLDPVRACPATTFYRSAMAHGVLESVDDVEEKAEILQALMSRFQPEGGHKPIRATDPLYQGAVRGIAITRLGGATLVGKEGVGEKHGADVRQRLVAHLWRRGDRVDLETIDAMLDHTPLAPPSPLDVGKGLRLRVAPTESEALAAAKLLAQQYWTQGLSLEEIRAAQLGSNAWLVVTDEDEELIATGRAVSDGARFGYILDVAVVDAARGKGLGAALMRALLDHPALRRTRLVELRTKTAGVFYERLGFSQPEVPAWRHPWVRRGVDYGTIGATSELWTHV